MSLLNYNNEERYTEDELIELLKATAKSGTPYKEIIDFFSDLDYPVLTKEPLSINALYDAIDHSPTMVCIQAYAPGKNVDYIKIKDRSHYVIAIGYEKDEYVCFMDPAIKGSYGYLTIPELKIRFRDDAGKSGGLIVAGRMGHKVKKINISDMREIK